MLKSYFLIAWRNLWKTRVSSFVNIVGLSTGLLCFIVILLYVKTELGFDSYHKNAAHIYRVVKDFRNDDGTRIPDATTPSALANALRNDLPEVATATRVFPAWGRQFLILYQDKGFYENNLLRIDSNFFDVFDFPFTHGNKANTFQTVRSIVLTQSSARKYFNNQDPIGKTVRININNGQDYIVTGIVKDVPKSSHFTFDFLIPFTAGRDSATNADWNGYRFYTYVLLKPNANAASFKEKLQPLFNKYQPKSKNVYYAQSLTDIHLRSNLKWELGANGDLSYIRILTVIAILVIIIAGINYVNLITAQSLKRAKEAGIRKIVGASKRLLVMQFLVEAVSTALISFIIALVAFFLLLPFLNQLMNSDLSLILSGNWQLWLALTGIALAIGLVAGLYPALYYAAFEPVKALKGKFITSLRGVYFRKSMVVFQFTISIVLIAGFITIYRQVDYITQKDPGFNKDNVLLVPNVSATGREAAGAKGSWLDELKRLPAVTDVARANGVLGGMNAVNGVSSGATGNNISLNFIRIDHSFLPALQLELVAGRNFFHSRSDSTSIILNEKAAAQLGLKKPYVGQQLEWDDAPGKTHTVTIVGITKDFHFTSLHEPIKPFGFLSEDSGSTFFIKLRSQDLSKDIAAVQQAWTHYNPDKPFNFSFLDEQFARQYQYDVRFKNLFSSVTVLAILIAALGLFGLSVFTTEARGKEVSIRKVLGASAGSLFTLLSKEFLLLILIAAIVAFPIAWWAMHAWLEGFAYRIQAGWWILSAAGGMAVLITLLTVGFHTVKAISANPVKRLRSE
jgi:putative ABC transport system permease protein